MKVFLASLLFLITPALFGGVEVTFEDVNEFRDFTIHGMFHQEQAKALMEKQIQSFWKRRLQKLIPEGADMKLHFRDIDMAGEMRSIGQFGQSYTRVVSDRYPPRLRFDYRLFSGEGDILAEGSEDLMAKDYTFRHRRSPPPGEVTFFHEFEMLASWLEGLELSKTQPG